MVSGRDTAALRGPGGSGNGNLGVKIWWEERMA